MKMSSHFYVQVNNVCVSSVLKRNIAKGRQLENAASTPSATASKNTAMLYGDALVWTAVLIDWLDLFELVYQSFELIGLTIIILLIGWLNESNISYVKVLYLIFDLGWSD